MIHDQHRGRERPADTPNWSASEGAEGLRSTGSGPTEMPGWRARRPTVEERNRASRLRRATDFESPGWRSPVVGRGRLLEKEGVAEDEDADLSVERSRDVKRHLFSGVRSLGVDCLTARGKRDPNGLKPSIS